MPIGKPINPSSDADKSTPPKNKKDDRPAIQFELSEAKYDLDDLILLDATRSDLNKAIGLRKHQKVIFEEWGLAKTHKYDQKMIINLYGEPGTGKTMAAHAIAKKLNKPLLIVSYADIESKYVGETPKNIQAAFKFAQENDAILFFDEADAILSRRVSDMRSSTDTSVNQTRSVMLTLLNEYDDVVLFATNFIKNYDPAFMRRILMHIEFPMPDLEGREKLFKHYIPEELPCDLDIKELALFSETLSGADISNSILLAAFGAKEEGKDKVYQNDLLQKLEGIKRSKEANSGIKVTVEVKEVPEDEVPEEAKKQFNESKTQLNKEENTKEGEEK